MSFLSRLVGGMPGKVKDPVLGALSFTDGQWAGRATWSHAPAPFSLVVHRADGVPTEADRTLYQSLDQDYRLLRSRLQGALHDLWAEARAKVDPQLPDFGSSLDLWERVDLQGMGLFPDGHVELIFGFHEEGDPEGALMISVHGREVEPLEYVE